ncbi:hypothetical protein LK542_19670 [Massilia sp. IC2-477]|uniref:hypothetical protein n=1 Tax=Massilia sp. IC2-477 TaxID=2887198 RepID=UPI001D0FE542|nr:hypothetical protein [Massilia sp. IC2-477]MCC2957843.1 hypothetical protein [Massilia sp. IC2-477]
MNKPPSLLWLFLVLALLAVFGFVGARYMLKAHSQSTLDQLAVVWPNIATMPEQERGFLVELAHTCNLTTREPVRAEVVDCLRSVRMDANASARLDRLLGQTAPAAPQR